MDSTLKKLKELDSIEHHRAVASGQRKAYNMQRTDIDFLEDKLLIDIDYKQKINLGTGP